MGIYEIKKPKKINSFSITMGFVLLAVGYGLYFIIPAWWPVFQESGIMQGICNDAYREFSDEKLMEKLLKESRRTGLRLTKDNFVLERVKWTTEEMNTKFQNNDFFANRGKECRLTMTVTSNAELPFIGKKTAINWKRTVSTDLSLVKY